MDVYTILNLINAIPSDFWIQLFATLLGVIAGIPIAFWIQEKIEAGKLREEKKYLIGFLSRNLKRNLELIKEAKEELSSQVIFYNLDLGAWHFVSQKIGLIKDNKLIEDISRAYYQLEHLSRKIDRQFEMHYSSFVAINNYQERRQALIAATINHINSLEKDLESILGRLNGSGQK